MGDAPRTAPEANLDAVVSEVAAEAHLRLDHLAPEERDYLILLFPLALLVARHFGDNASGE